MQLHGPRVLRLLRLISYAQLRTSWGRTVLVIGGITTGVALMVAIAVINTSVLGNLLQTIDLIAGPAQLEVTLGVGEIGFDETIAERVRADRDVAAAVPLVRGFIALADDTTAALQLFGADLTMEDAIGRYHVSTRDRQSVLRGFDDPRSVLLTTQFADQHGLKIGDEVRMSTPHGITPLVLSGLLETSGLASALNGRLAVMDLPAAQRLLHKEHRLDQVDVVLRPGVETSATRDRLQQTLGPTLAVIRPEQRGAQYERIVSAFQVMLSGLSALCLVAGVFIIYNTTSTAAVRRASVMGELRLLGADQGVLFGLLLAEAGVLGVIGAVIGVGYGILLAHFLVGMVSESMGVIFQLSFPVQELTVGFRQQAPIALLGIGTALFASSFAAYRAARTEPLDLLRKESQHATPRSRTAVLVGAWLGMLAVAALGLFLQKELKSFVWGNFGSTIWNSSVLLIAIPIVGWSVALWSRLLPRIFGPEGRFAAESLARSRVRAGITVAAVALVLAVAVTVTTLALSFRRSVASYSGAGGFLLGDLVASSMTTSGGWLEAPLPADVGDRIRGVPGVQDVQAWRVVFGQMYRGERIALFALDDGLLDPARFGQRWYRDGDARFAAAAIRDGNGVDISTALADQFDLRIGDSIDLDTPTGPAVLRVVGIVYDYLSDRGNVMMSRRLLSERWQEPSVSRFHVFVTPGTDAAEVQAQISRAVQSEHRIKILPLRDVVEYQASAIDRAFAFTDAIQLLIAIVTVAGIFDLLLTAISERRRELALWRMIGAEDRVVRRSVVIESATIGLLGAGLGLAVGIVTAAIWIYLNFPHLLGFQLEYHFPWWSVAWYLVLVMAMTIASGYLAARDATSQSIVDSLPPE